MESVNDPVPPETLDLMRKLGVSYKLTTFFPGPNVPPSTYPLTILPPPGFHFNGGEHSMFLRGWKEVVDELLGAVIVPCDNWCPPPPGPVRRRGAPPLDTRPKDPSDTGDA